MSRTRIDMYHTDQMHVRALTAKCYLDLSGWGYYYISKVMQESNTVHEQTTYVMCDTNTFSHVIPLFLMALRIS